MRFKDINECLQAGVAASVIAACVANAEVLRPEKLKEIYDFEEEIWQKFHPSDKASLGLTLPWGNHHGSSLPFRFRRGEVTVWTGYNKHGKSEVLNHVMIDLCWQGERALVCSLEVQAPETYRKLVRMALGRREVIAPEEREQFREKCLAPLADKIWVYDHVGNAGITDVLNVMLYAYQRYGCRQFVLDSLMKFEGLDGEGQDQWNQQKEFMGMLCKFSMTYQVHIHLVAHSRKPEKGSEAIIPRRYNINGSGHISNLASNVIVVWRNRAKQDALEEIFQAATEVWIRDRKSEPTPQWKRLLGGHPGRNAAEHLKRLWDRMIDTIEKGLARDYAEEFLKLVQKHDAYLIVDAQRGGDGDTPARHLWFHYDSLQFLEVSPWKGGGDKRCEPTCYATRVPAQANEAPAAANEEVRGAGCEVSGVGGAPQVSDGERPELI